MQPRECQKHANKIAFSTQAVELVPVKDLVNNNLQDPLLSTARTRNQKVCINMNITLPLHAKPTFSESTARKPEPKHRNS